jgi:hypothetical protein
MEKQGQVVDYYKVPKKTMDLIIKVFGQMKFEDIFQVVDIVKGSSQVVFKEVTQEEEVKEPAEVA